MLALLRAQSFAPMAMALAQAMWGLGRSAVKTTGLAPLAVAVAIRAAWGTDEVVLLMAAGGVYALVRTMSRSHRPSMSAALVTGAGGSTRGAALAAASAGGGVAAASASFGPWSLFLVFAKVGAVLFGSGYVLIAFLRADLAQRLGWLTERVFLDATAVVGQITPGPVCADVSRRTEVANLL